MSRTKLTKSCLRGCIVLMLVFLFSCIMSMKVKADYTQPILFLAAGSDYEQGVSMRIYIVNADGSELKPLLAYYPNLLFGIANDKNGNILIDAKISDVPNLLLFKTNKNKMLDNTDVTSASREICFGANMVVRLDCIKVILSSGANFSPAFSPDGKKIAYFFGASSDIFISNADGTGKINLTKNSERMALLQSGNFAKLQKLGPPIAPDINCGKLSFSPDGKRLAFCEVNSDKSSEPTVDDILKETDPDKSSELESKGNMLSEISIINIDGTGHKMLTNNEFADYSPAFSPDGKQILFASNRSGNYEIYIMNLADKAVKKLTNNTANDYSPCFSPDGKQIVFVSKRDGNQEIYLMNADGSSQKNLTNTSTDDYAPVFAGCSNGKGIWDVDLMKKFENN